MNQSVTHTQVIDQIKAAYGFVPNLMAGMAQHNPAVAHAYLALSSALAGGVLTESERQVGMLAVSSFNDCHYCTAVHRTVAKSMGVDQDTLDTVDALMPPTDPRLRALVETTWALLRAQPPVNIAHISPASVSPAELFELIGVIGLKTISNTVNRVMRTEVDEPFRTQATRKLTKEAFR